MKNLTAMRIEIDAIDNQLVALLGKRFELTQRVGLYKAEHALPVQDEERENDQYLNYKNLAHQHDVSEALIAELFNRIIGEVKVKHKKLIN